MSETVIAELKSLMAEKRISQVAICRYLNNSAEYSVTPAELSNAVNGVYGTPKMQRILNDALAYARKA
jgi:hypothetical protein